ncbi:MAG TPA: L-threonylcarbamoyladenylate synthase [Bauldia sp.]|nr:L-threonylcarbamoyladenylate synthase [Bauldia sp.]
MAVRIRSASDPAAVAEAAGLLRAGELVAMPTETVYGLAADATNARAVAGIFAAKGRPRFNPLIVHVPDAAAAQSIVTFTDEAARLAAAFWPGPLTLVLPRRGDAVIADLVTAGLPTIAIRVPSHPVAQALLQETGRPLAAPSANRSGHVSATTAQHVAADFADAVAMVLDAGPSPVGIESTIVGLAGTPTLLRAGGLARADIEKALGMPLAVPAAGVIAAPGMLASHYAPDAALRLNAKSVMPGEALLAFGEPPPGAVVTVNLSPTRDLREAAANLFAALRALDAEADAIAVMPIPNEGLGEAINDRLQRAAAPRS